MKRMWILILAMAGAGLSSCSDLGDDMANRQARISTDAALYAHVTQTDPFAGYTLFPLADSVTSGTLNGSTAHQTLVRVSLNSVAAAALSGGRFSAPFPDGSVVFKEIRNAAGQTQLYAVMYKDAANPLAGNGWLWAEYYPDGRAFISVTTRGVNCTSCHAREQGPQHDFVRTFERQR